MGELSALAQAREEKGEDQSRSMKDIPTPYQGEINPQTFKKAQPHPLLASLPSYLKDYGNFEKVMKAILDAGATKHSHAEVVDWAGCKHCQGKQADRLRMMRALGFQNAAQFMAWRKVMETITKRITLPKYNK